MGMTRALVGSFLRISAFTSASTRRISSAVMGALWLKSKRVLSSSTSEPFWWTCVPSTSRNALCMRCVAEWWRMVRARLSRSTLAATVSPSASSPVFTTPWWPKTSGWIFCVSCTSKSVRQVPPLVSSPLSPTWPPDSA